MSKRHPSLVILSQDHHHGLALALRLRQGNDALLNDGWTHDRVEQARRVQRFYEDDLRSHFVTEEEIIFPFVKKRIPAAASLIGQLIEQHREMEMIVGEIGHSEGKELESRLVALGTVLEKHIRSEERELFETMQARLSSGMLDALDDDVKRIRGAS